MFTFVFLNLKFCIFFFYHSRIKNQTEIKHILEVNRYDEIGLKKIAKLAGGDSLISQVELQNSGQSQKNVLIVSLKKAFLI